MTSPKCRPQAGVHVELRRGSIGMLRELTGSDDWMAVRANGSVAFGRCIAGNIFAG
jgi:hypothetical protein